MKSFLATTALVLVMGGSAFAASNQPIGTYQSQPGDIRASQFIGKTVYATENDVDPNQVAKAGSEKDWDNVGDINEVILDKTGDVKAVVLGVGGFLGMGEKNVAVNMNDVKFVRNGDGADDYYLVINASKDVLAKAPAYDMNKQTAADTTAAPATTDDTAANTAPAADNTASNDMAANNATDDATKGAAVAGAGTTAADPNPMDNSATSTQAANGSTSGTDMQTTASTTSDSGVSSAMDENRTRLTPPSITPDGYKAAQATDITADKLEGARVYGAKDEDVGEVANLVLDNKGQVQFVVLDIGGFLGMGEHRIAVTPNELNIVQKDGGDDVRVYIDANKDTLKAQPEYKGKS